MVPANTCRRCKAVTNAAEFWVTWGVLVSHAALRPRSPNADGTRVLHFLPTAHRSHSSSLPSMSRMFASCKYTLHVTSPSGTRFHVTCPNVHGHACGTLRGVGSITLIIAASASGPATDQRPLSDGRAFLRGRVAWPEAGGTPFEWRSPGHGARSDCERRDARAAAHTHPLQVDGFPLHRPGIRVHTAGGHAAGPPSCVYVSAPTWLTGGARLTRPPYGITRGPRWCVWRVS